MLACSQRSSTEAKLTNTVYTVDDSETAIGLLCSRGWHLDVPTPDLVLFELQLHRVLRRVRIDSVSCSLAN